MDKSECCCHLSKTLTYANTHRGKLQKSKSSVEVQHDYGVLLQIAQNTNTSMAGMPWWSLPLFYFLITSSPVYCCSCNCKCQTTVTEPLALWQQKLYLNQLEKLYRIIPFLPLFIPKFIPVRHFQHFRFLHWKVFSHQVHVSWHWKVSFLLGWHFQLFLTN